MRIVLDDVRREDGPASWSYQSLFTFKDYAPGRLEDVASIPEKELADFGYYILARLLASNGHGT